MSYDEEKLAADFFKFCHMTFEQLNAEDRVKFIRAVMQGYCIHCGNKKFEGAKQMNVDCCPWCAPWWRAFE